MERPTVAVIGAGYWGPNLARNFRSCPDWDLIAVCDLDEDRAARVVGERSTVAVETSVERLLERPDLDAVAIATPARTHAPLVKAALAAGKHVLVEKPLADSVAAGEEMVRAAEDAGRTLMIDHTFCYTPAVRHIRSAIADGLLGDILYVDSVRINLGIVQPDVSVFWDLAPHDLSILDFILPGGLQVASLAAMGGDPIGAGQACVGYATLKLAGGAIAHLNVNWLSPTKIRQFVVGGSRRTLVWDDLNPMQRVSLHDRGVDVQVPRGNLEARRKRNISYRMGDITVPALAEREALGAMVAEFAAAIAGDRAPQTDGVAGLRVLALLEAIDNSLETGASVTPTLPLTRERIRP